MPQPPRHGPALDSFITQNHLAGLIQQAKHEDLGPNNTDLTTVCLIRPDQLGQAVLRARQPGRLAGAALLPAIVAAYDTAIDLQPLINDGQPLGKNDSIAQFTGPLCSILALERIALNFMTHLSGIATLTSQYVQAVASTNAQVCDTRKTIPGLRALQKYAVACGGGHNHRAGLYDAVLVKDNHIAHLSLQDLPDTLGRALNQARAATVPPRFIEVEIDTLDQLACILNNILPPPDRLLLDNMTPDQLRQAVGLRDSLAPGVVLEASGGVSLKTVAQIAHTGVDLISVGALTHSAPALDLGLDIT